MLVAGPRGQGRPSDHTRGSPSSSSGHLAAGKLLPSLEERAHGCGCAFVVSPSGAVVLRVPCFSGWPLLSQGTAPPPPVLLLHVTALLRPGFSPSPRLHSRSCGPGPARGGHSPKPSVAAGGIAGGGAGCP